MFIASSLHLSIAQKATAIVNPYVPENHQISRRINA